MYVNLNLNQEKAVTVQWMIVGLLVCVWPKGGTSVTKKPSEIIRAVFPNLFGLVTP